MIKNIVIISLESLHFIYKRTISAMLGSRCRFFPSCSDYSLEAVRTFGLLKGSLMCFGRVLRCNPWHPGGYDPVHKADCCRPNIRKQTAELTDSNS